MRRERPEGACADPAGADHAAWVAEQQRWASGWRRIIFPTAFLAYLLQVVAAIPADSHGAGRVAGYAVLALFAAGYELAVPILWLSERGYVALIGAMGALCLAELPFAHADALVMGVFVTGLAMVRFAERGFPVMVAFAAIALFLPPLVGSWHDTLATGLDNGTVIAIVLTGCAMYGFGRVVQGNSALSAARAELARLAAENERTRIARDLHDLLGHSLTTITVKAELARKLGGQDVETALAEIGEVATLSRRALADVRAAVSGYRDVTLAGELATGRELLRAAGIAAELPRATDLVDDDNQELFGWVVREGLTNVVRHSHARTCTVRVCAATVEIVDDGVGSPSGRGSGLRGLAERVVAAGGVLETGPAQPSGWRLAVRLDAAEAR